ncbi:hypothetical protein COLO4_17308 [Corchorus olitorius]|uniref:F-box domain-containing protein n=1 Tax=Corchorus olitorius TaxID=93759 RepID=A0A1R3JDD0_9ROSI|nr:hypothetical protein COLO4_17308 [Corchorus olitorius]
MVDLDQPPSKHRRISSDENGIDLISDLLDSVLCHIMSFLPTEDAFATSILSKRWVDLWTQVPAFVFDSPHHYRTIDGLIVISLKRIAVMRRSAHYIPWNDPPYKLLINAPMLERIVLKDENYRYFLLEDGYNLAEAVVEISNPLADGRNLCDLLEVFGR